MDNTILNIVSKKENLSYPLIFSKIRKYYWNEDKIKIFFNTLLSDIIEESVKNKWYRILKVLIHSQINYPLNYAVSNGHLKVVKFLAENGANINSYNDGPLRWAARNGYFDIVKYIVENGADIHADDDYALRIAAYYGRFQVVKYLVENGADIHAENDHAIRRAAENGHLKVVKYLVENGANIQDTLLKLCSEKGHSGIAEYLKLKKI